MLLIALVAALLVIVLVSGSLAAFGAAGSGPLAFLHSGASTTGTSTTGGTNPGGTTAPGSTATTAAATGTTAPKATNTPASAATSTPLPAPVYSMVSRYNTASVPNGSSISVTASCQGSEQLVGGGYYVQDTNQLYNAESS